MSRGGMMIRLIDVVFILLFGFIAISEVTDRSKIELPKSENTPKTPPDREKLLIVGVADDGSYLVDNEMVRLTSPKELYNYLATKKEKAGGDAAGLLVRVRPNWNTPIKYTMLVASICDKLNIVKGMDVKRTGRSGI